jgi:hypothetical protein
MSIYNCKNCGHSSHCGVPLYKDFENGTYAREKTLICKHCRCEGCLQKTDFG